ncbi:hypothetical protein HCN44_001249 [Aphidius gifuensis]|uniref:ABC transporter domain-containing protein n=1 Tax=Aphidius gifuensis TaxID=684658 RepID=A0A834XL25_APHGI|nr:hypothetical protein HCN44_001249 [Aphidius gifuensis]
MDIHQDNDTCMIQMTEKEDENLIDNSGIDINFSKISYTPSKQKKEILKNVNGYFKAQSLNVIIGKSGAGKTSLLSVICGNKSSNVKGEILLNNVIKSPEILRKTICYIPQEFDLLPWMTTRETIYFSVCLKIPKNYGQSFQTIAIAEKLGLNHCLETMTDCLSGGEKKRLSIAIEIVTDPSILFLDEPTSGLDSTSLANSGCTIVTTIHQPSSHMMTMIDVIMVLSEGQSLYCGPKNKIIETFKEAGFICPPFYNICEFTIEVATGQRGGDLETLKKLSEKNYQSSHLSLIELDEEKLGKKLMKKKLKVSYIDELKVLLWRAIICILRDNLMTTLRLAAHVFIGLLIGIVFYNFGNEADKIPSNIACIFFFILFLFFANAMPAVEMFPIEAGVFFREHVNHWYHLWTYYLAKILTDLPLQIINPTIFLSIAYWMTGQPMELDRFMKAWLISFLITILAQSCGILTGAIFDIHVGGFLVPAVNIPMILFAGFFLKLGEIPIYLQPLSVISYFRYAFEGFLQAIYLDNNKLLNCSTSICLLQVPKKILKYMDMPTISFSTTIFALIVWISILHILIYTVLRCKFTSFVK